MILVVVNNFHFVLQAIFPAKDDLPLLVDANAPVSSQIPLELFKSIAWWNFEIFYDPRLIKHSQLAPGSLLYVARQATDSHAAIDALSCGIAETLDHMRKLTSRIITSSVITLGETIVWAKYGVHESQSICVFHTVHVFSFPSRQLECFFTAAS